MMSQQIKDAFKKIENITAQVENNLDNGANTQQLVKYFYTIKEIIIKTKIDLKIINESKM